MKRSSKGFVLLAALLTFAPQVLPAERSENHDPLPLSIHVRVHNWAQVSSEILIRAEAQAAEIFGKAGVQITWINCDPAQANLGDAAECSQIMTPTSLVVRILPHFGVFPGTSSETLGFAVGDLASVSFSRVSEEAAKFKVWPHEVLGPAIAHEIGHLLGLRGHSLTGIMRASWGRRDYEAPLLGAFKFAADQAEQMRAEVRGCERQQAAEAHSVTVSSHRSSGIDPR